ncbi:hypothetical protein AB0C28_47440 [Nonomuraea sp. NPDC048892]|uniref:hypothetical protein n=1 Tax=Nonomuraea sp. NPDC048892 TaxID=3154624 RepID=UPI0033DDEFA9
MAGHQRFTVPVPRITEARWADPAVSRAWRRSVDDALIDDDNPLPPADQWDDEDWDNEDEDD